MRYTDRLHEILDKTLDRLKLASVTQFDNELRFAWKKMHKVGLFLSIFENLRGYAPKDIVPHDIYYGMKGKLMMKFEDHHELAGYCYFVLDGFVPKNFDLGRMTAFGTTPDSRQTYVISDLITPLFNFLHDTLEANGFVLYLLEKYKKRTEWFLQKDLSKMYEQHKVAKKKPYEDVFENDLRLFLFDQGIDYPFSTPMSASGRADVVGALDTEDPIVIEIKIVDSGIPYRKERIRSGFSQAVKYTSDYNKDFGYLVIFNIDDREIHFDFADQHKGWPPRLELGGKTFYFIVVDLYSGESASKLKSLPLMTVTLEDLIDAED